MANRISLSADLQQARLDRALKRAELKKRLADLQSRLAEKEAESIRAFHFGLFCKRLSGRG